MVIYLNLLGLLVVIPAAWSLQIPVITSHHRLPPPSISLCWTLNNNAGRKPSTFYKQQRSISSSSSLNAASSSRVDTDEFDTFMDELSSDQPPSTTKPTNIPSHFIQGETAVGIGGNTGYTYDVNKLKRNLVQESIRGCKEELLVLLGDGRQSEASSNFGASSSKSSTTTDKKEKQVPRWRRDRDDLIEERLTALVQANPVSTTTDSNLLDGEWSFAFATNAASSILDTSRFLLSKTKRTDDNAETAQAARGGPWSFRAGKAENPFRTSTRQIYLENLVGDDNAHIIDETRVLGGLFQIRRRYDVYSLTRTAIDLDLTESESALFGLLVNSEDKDDFKGTKQGQPLEIQVIYLDNDLCICTTGAGLDGPLHVYTKSDLWVTGGAKRKLRLIGRTASWISQMQSPLRIRQRIMNVLSRESLRSILKSNPDLKAINIGELEADETKEDHVWDGPDDPFLHLSAGERMEVMRTMTLQDIYDSATERKQQNKNEKRKWWRNKSNRFKRPDV